MHKLYVLQNLTQKVTGESGYNDSTTGGYESIHLDYAFKLMILLVLILMNRGCWHQTTPESSIFGIVPLEEHLLFKSRILYFLEEMVKGIC